MSASALAPPLDKKRDSDREGHAPPAQEIRDAMRLFTLMSIPFDLLWHHLLRQLHVKPPRAHHTLSVYAFWSGVWYCASRSGDWTHAAIARDRERAMTAPLPAYDGIWDHRTVSAVATAKNVPRRREQIHLFASASFTIVPVFARLTFAYLSWFWQRRVFSKTIWCSMAGCTSLIAFRAAKALSDSRSQDWVGK